MGRILSESELIDAKWSLTEPDRRDLAITALYWSDKARSLDLMLRLTLFKNLEHNLTKRALDDVVESAKRILIEGHKFWQDNQNSPDSDEMSAALTDLHMALLRHGLDGLE